ncbi:unnamed protein product [Linum trigynum]|uniref:Uncharacterized protein n=1 Tax=Linum trigynum TaxID=586398 RepID=A0AAV2F5R6_9ROSI
MASAVVFRKSSLIAVQLSNQSLSAVVAKSQPLTYSTSGELMSTPASDSAPITIHLTNSVLHLPSQHLYSPFLCSCLVIEGERCRRRMEVATVVSICSGRLSVFITIHGRSRSRREENLHQHQSHGIEDTRDLQQ